MNKKKETQQQMVKLVAKTHNTKTHSVLCNLWSRNLSNYHFSFRKHHTHIFNCKIESEFLSLSIYFYLLLPFSLSLHYISHITLNCSVSLILLPLVANSCGWPDVIPINRHGEMWPKCTVRAITTTLPPWNRNVQINLCMQLFWLHTYIHMERERERNQLKYDTLFPKTRHTMYIRPGRAISI